MLCTVGKSSNFRNHVDIEVKELGFLKDQKQLSKIYAAADLFVIPSIEDNLPNTVLEALCCGTPVVGFDTGGISDMVKEGENGFLSANINAKGLVKAMGKFLKDGNKLDQYKIRSEAVKKYDHQVQVKKHVHLYEKVLNQGIKTIIMKKIILLYSLLLILNKLNQLPDIIYHYIRLAWVIW